MKSILESFYTFFPPPKFLQMPTVGLSLSGNGVRFLEIIHKNGQNEIGRFGEKFFSEDCIANGAMQDPESVKKVLTEIAEESSIKYVRSAIPERKGFIVKMDIPHVKESEIRGVIELHLEEFIPLKASDLAFDYSIVRVKGTDCDMLEVQVSALPKRVLAEYEALFLDTGLTPLSFEIEAQAIARSVVPHGDPGAFLVVDLDTARSGVYVVEKEVVRFTSSLDTSACILQEELKNKHKMNDEEVQEFISTFDVNTGEDQTSSSKAETVHETLSVLREEIDKYYVYWQTHNKSSSGTGIEKVILTGSMARLPGLVEYMSEHLKVPVEVGDPWRNVFDTSEYIPPISREGSHAYVTACGLALHRAPVGGVR